MRRVILFAALILLETAAIAGAARAQAAAPDVAFPPFQQWKAAVVAGDAKGLEGLYSTNPPAEIEVNRVTHDASADVRFWTLLKARRMNVAMIRSIVHPDRASFIFKAEVVSDYYKGQTVTLTNDQSWRKQCDQWRIVSVERTEKPRLEQPANMKKDIYPVKANAHAEIKEAEAAAAKEHKRLLLVFGANWCFDCHVLDLAFQRPDLAPILAANYEVVHVDLGPDEKKNADLVKEYQIPLDKGIPALAVAESNGKLVVSQKEGEFEDARGLTPQVLAAFLNKWKPEAQ